MITSSASRASLVVGALLGAMGVMSAAAASHLSGNYAAIATIALAHGPVLVALGLFGLRTRLLMLASALLALGCLLFCGDLAVRIFAGNGLFPMSAPLGGLMMIAGWFGLAIAGLMTKS